ncbi:MAG: hypothetical protein NT007_01425 [Candidatus Kapabacteria bacterium]|nr:hypothetical protein [Candidatus Kapabacteria bacterium]
MKIKSLWILILLLILIPIKSNSQNLTNLSFDNTFGLKYSNLSGYGFYYNRKITDDFRVQLMALAFYLSSDDSVQLHDNYNYDFGIEFQRDMYKTKNLRLYLLAGAYYYHDYDLLDIHKIKDKTMIRNNSFNVGVGIAAEYTYWRIVFSLNLGYKYFEDHRTYTINDDRQYPALTRVTKVGIGFGAGFQF